MHERSKDAEDCVQNVFVNLFKNKKEFQDAEHDIRYFDFKKNACIK